jgi:hypothetical protein
LRNRYWLTNSTMMERYLPFVIVALVAMLTVGAAAKQQAGHLI